MMSYFCSMKKLLISLNDFKRSSDIMLLNVIKINKYIVIDKYEGTPKYK